ncbi:type II toxin-antitoxin system Phd/YefM family antitoxin [Pseudomonas sp. C27(2019)]|uniref:type II toxin-antitoxin system Phd/YefM family antitoxin n=1 Tax=Pseudomonas sp. C27(2019) TaxID=2604941 RepID=UPI0015B5185B|nr:type II toxin-antitoxin system Phd/YefM family antitoxin [Pseudomonas sp. C27(2019)]
MSQLTPLLASVSASVTDLKKDPMGIIRGGLGETVVILNRNEPAFYAVPPAQYEMMMQLIDDAYLAELVKQRQDDPVEMVDINDLIQQAR